MDLRSLIIVLLSTAIIASPHTSLKAPRNQSFVAAKSCNSSNPCGASEVCYNTKTKSSAEGVCIGSVCSETTQCPAGQYCGHRLIGNAGPLGADGPVWSGTKRCIDLSLACGEDVFFPACGCPSSMECIEGDWERAGTPFDTNILYHFCGPKMADWGNPKCAVTSSSDGERCELITRVGGAKVCVL
jgi:hypothetical protein